MPQVTRSIALDVRPTHRDKLVQILADLRGPGRPDQTVANHAFLTALPGVHFFAICVFESADYDPLLVIEANFDGAAGPFWAQLQQQMGEALRQILRCCKRPRDDTCVLYDCITRTGSSRDPAPFLECQAMHPRVFFRGSRGMTRARILAEADLAEAIQAELGDGGAEWQKMAPEHLHLVLRDALGTRFPWLAEPGEKRIPATEIAGNWIKLVLLLFVALFALTVPGMLLAAILPGKTHALLVAIVAIPLWVFLSRYRRPLPGVGTGEQATIPKVSKSHPLPIVLGVAGLFLASWPVVAGLLRTVWRFQPHQAWDFAAVLVAWGIGWVALVMLPAAFILLRFLERHDSSLSAPVDNPASIKAMAEFEDWLPQNHMASLVSLRPQILRRVLAYFLTTALRFALLAIVKDGYLGSMRTIHFAHWAFTNNGSRMLFMSNYDLSWESYFDDFIEKAHEGMTLIWGGSVGFPPTTMLIEDGAAHGRAFKRWARHSMAPTRFWVSAYPHLTVDQIERNNRIADGLRKPGLTPAAAATWIADL